MAVERDEPLSVELAVDEKHIARWRLICLLVEP
jgi:hypothetical protein